MSTVTVHAYVPSNGNSEEEIKEPLLPKKEEIPHMIPAEVPVWESFYAWLEQLNPVKRSKLEKAVIYAKNHKETLPV